MSTVKRCDRCGKIIEKLERSCFVRTQKFSLMHSWFDVSYDLCVKCQDDFNKKFIKGAEFKEDIQEEQ